MLTYDPPWEPVPKFRTHEQVLAQIEEHILRGRLRPGDRLPSERELVQALGVGRTSVREALRVLQAMGIIESRGGIGRESGSAVAGVPTRAWTNLLRLHMALSRFSLQDLVEVRVELERWAAARAAERSVAEEVRPLADFLTAMSDRGLEPGQFNELDTAFHVAIAVASGNALLADLMQALRDAVQEQMVLAFDRLPDWRSAADVLIGEHRQILDAITAGDASGAATAVERHIKGFYRSAIHDDRTGSDAPAG